MDCSLLCSSSIGFFKQEYWSGLPFPTPDLKTFKKNYDHGIQSHHSWQRDGETMETVTDFIVLGSKITADMTAAMKLEDACSLEEKL